MERVALYLHFPYCRSRCSYCDFNAHLGPDGQQPRERYLSALLSDIAQQPRQQLRSIFMGGGTPTFFSGEELARVLEACRRQFHWPQDIEVTCEANPGTTSANKLERLRRAGVNRISFGVQSFDPALLKLLGRIHGKDEVLSSVRAARQAGFDNLSLDLIFGLPRQSVEQWSKTLHQALELEPDHLSVYQLMVEPGTRLEAQIRTGELALPPEETMEAMDDLTQQLLPEHDYGRYEVSNWARPGRECRHNLIYWSDEPYLGLGCGAVSWRKGWRSKRISHPHFYAQALEKGHSPVVEVERLGSEGALKDTITLALRTRDGLDLDKLSLRYPEIDRTLVEAFFEELPREWLEISPARVKLTPQGLDLASEVVFRLMDTKFLTAK